MLVSRATSSHAEHNTYCALEAKVILYILAYLQWLNQFVPSVKEIWTKVFHLWRKPKLFFQILVLYSAENNLHLFLKIYFMLLFAIWKEIRWKIFAVCLLYYYSLARRNNDFPRRKHYCKLGYFFFFLFFKAKWILIVTKKKIGLTTDDSIIKVFIIFFLILFITNLIMFSRSVWAFCNVFLSSTKIARVN